MKKPKIERILTVGTVAVIFIAWILSSAAIRPISGFPAPKVLHVFSPNWIKRSHIIKFNAFVVESQ